MSNDTDAPAMTTDECRALEAARDRLIDSLRAMLRARGEGHFTAAEDHRYTQMVRDLARSTDALGRARQLSPCT